MDVIKRAGRLALPVVLAVLVVALLLGAMTALAQGGVTDFDSVVVHRNLVVRGTSTLGGNAVVGTWQSLTPQTSITVTQDGAITPTGTYQPVAAAAAVSTGAIAAGTAGRLLVLVGSDDTNTVTISRTTTIKLGGATRALGAQDTLTLLSDGTNWIELGFVNNS
jgi:hypothetical protein